MSNHLLLLEIDFEHIVFEDFNAHDSVGVGVIAERHVCHWLLHNLHAFALNHLVSELEIFNRHRFGLERTDKIAKRHSSRGFAHAEAIVQKFLQAETKSKKIITLLSVSLAPHVKRSTAGNFSALFGALEDVIALRKLTSQEKEKLRETDDFLIKAILEKKCEIEATKHPTASAVAARLQGYANSVGNSGPSFNVRFEKFRAAYPSLSVYMSDLWPIQGSENKPGLKQFRDSLAHGLRQKYSHQAIAVAHWHFSRLAERLAFLVLGIDIPMGIRVDSYLLHSDHWYNRATWQAEQISAKRLE